MARPKKLSASEIADQLAHLPHWTRQGDEIVRIFVFADFVAAIAFVNALADAAERIQHHPDLDIRYGKVTVRLTTHDAGGLTEFDFALARTAETLTQP